MDTKLFILAISVAAFSSCSTIYKSGQTPDDVYYSPARPSGSEYVAERRDDRNYDRNYYNNEDRAIRMGIYDPRWRYLDNDFRYNPYSYGFNYGYYYNPYFWPYPVFNPIFITPSNPKITSPRTSNLGGYGTNYNKRYVDPKSGSGKQPARSYNNSNKGSAFGNVLRQVITPSNPGNNTYNNSNNNSSNNNNRTYSPSSGNSGSSSSGRPSSGGGISRPSRGAGN